MRITEIVLGALSVVAAIMGLFLIPGGNIITFISLTLLMLLHLVFGFAIYNGLRFRKIFKKENWQGISSLQVFGSIAAGISVAALIVGIMYKIMIWPGSNIILQSGLFFALITAIVALIKRKQSKAPIYGQSFKRLIIYGVVAIICFATPTDMILDFKYRDYPAYLEVKKRLIKDPYNRILLEAEREAFDEMMKERQGK